VVLAIEIMDHRGGEDKDEDNGHSLFHAFTIIPSLGARVKRRRPSYPRLSSDRIGL
jgi:hypothetical protein